MSDYYHCRFCNFKSKKWYHNKKGKLRNGMKRLISHVAWQHMPEYEAQEDWQAGTEYFAHQTEPADTNHEQLTELMGE